MSFYRDYRPSKFGDIIGQSTAIEAVKRSIQAGRQHHSYLLHGASGSGKTTTARVIAMALNCEAKGQDGEPCGVCPSCEAVKESRHWDVLEIDAARTRSIEDVKSLCYKAQFSPMGKFKVYIIDEAHQFGMPSWSALLKTIEEPPPNIVFIFCTTDYADIPETIRSRCQSVEFGKAEPQNIAFKLGKICASLKLSIDDSSLRFIAETSNGNYRTAENLLEQQCWMQPQPQTMELAIA
jgi:DNA polymerase-3 subunit gamma/tau